MRKHPGQAYFNAVVIEVSSPQWRIKITQGRITMMDGSHLFPMEHPLQTAAAIDAAIKAMKNPVKTRI
jgi:hypothetical protein